MSILNLIKLLFLMHLETLHFYISAKYSVLPFLSLQTTNTVSVVYSEIDFYLFSPFSWEHKYFRFLIPTARLKHTTNTCRLDSPKIHEGSM